MYSLALLEAKSRNTCSIKLRRELYCLKKFGRMWYNCLSEYLSKEGYKNNLIYLCVFIKKFTNGYAIVVVYVDDINLIRSPEELEKISSYLNKEF